MAMDDSPFLTLCPAKRAIPVEGGRLDVLVRLEVPPLERQAAVREPIALSLVIDRSGSMAGAKRNAARRAAQQLVRMLTPTDRVAVVSFAGEIRTELPLTRASAAALEAIGAIEAGAGTALFGGWERGMRLLLEARDLAHHEQRVLLLSDGHANQGPTRSFEVVPDVLRACRLGIGTSCIGLGEDCQERLIAAMAGASRGNLVHFNGTTELEPVFRAELAGLSLWHGQDLRFRLLPAAGVTLQRVHSPIRPQADGSFPLGALQAGAPALAAQLEVSAVAAQGRTVRDLLAVAASWRDADGMSHRREAWLRLPQVPLAAWQALPSDRQVASAVARAVARD